MARAPTARRIWQAIKPGGEPLHILLCELGQLWLWQYRCRTKPEPHALFCSHNHRRAQMKTELSFDNARSLEPRCAVLWSPAVFYIDRPDAAIRFLEPQLHAASIQILGFEAALFG